MEKFKNRRDAGQKLARQLMHLKTENPIVLALPRGGIPVATEVVKSLRCSFNLMLVKKIGVPWHLELAAGAVTPGLEPFFNHGVLENFGLTPSELQGVVDEKLYEISLLQKKFGTSNEKLDVGGRTVILVDDGIATGSTARVAIQMLKNMEAGKIILAVPVGAKASLDNLREITDQVVAVHEPEDLLAVGYWYEDFSQVSEDEAVTQFKKAHAAFKPRVKSSQIEIPVAQGLLTGHLSYTKEIKAWVIFSHGSGSNHMSSRNRQVAKVLNERGYGTLLFNLLTAEEEHDREKIFDIELLSGRLLIAQEWLKHQPEYKGRPIVYFGASTGAASALRAASNDKANDIYAVISRGGRPDLALESLDQVYCPVLLIVGENDREVLKLNQAAQKRLRHAQLQIVQNAGHLFSEPGTLDEVTRLTLEHLKKTVPQWVPTESGRRILANKRNHQHTPQ